MAFSLDFKGDDIYSRFSRSPRKVECDDDSPNYVFQLMKKDEKSSEMALLS